MHGKENVWQKFLLNSHCYAVLCYANAMRWDAMKSMLLACQACEILFESVSVYFVRRYFSNFSYGIENHSTCIPRRSYSTLLLPSSPTPPRRHSLAHSFRSEGEKNERKTIELVCYYLLTSWSIMIDVIERVEWNEMKWRDRAREQQQQQQTKTQHSSICTTGKIPLRNWCVRLISPVLFGMFDDVRCTSGQMLKHFLPNMCASLSRSLFRFGSVAL